MNKVIFLDFDGPMIPVRAYWLPNQTKPASVFDPLAVTLINKLVEESGAKIVISSTWQRLGQDRVFETLTKNGIDVAHVHEDWATQNEGRLKFSSQRIHEIKWWLGDHPEVTHYVAIDDEDLEVSFVPNAVLADAYEGFSLRNFLEARLMLDIYTNDKVGEQKREEHKQLATYLRRKEIWRHRRAGEEGQHLTFEFADELYPNNNGDR